MRTASAMMRRSDHVGEIATTIPAAVTAAMGVQLGVRALDRARVTVSGEARTDGGDHACPSPTCCALWCGVSSWPACVDVLWTSRPRGD